MIREKIEGTLQTLEFCTTAIYILFHEDKLLKNFNIYDMLVI